mmetsp:Transcript_53435/g.100211  ORF Transcript_53435/g.100211 Transcript_53435/m.100211 type:complete len:92 (+) Transcript_53435:3044-3319(+)
MQSVQRLETLSGKKVAMSHQARAARIQRRIFPFLRRQLLILFKKAQTSKSRVVALVQIFEVHFSQGEVELPLRLEFDFPTFGNAHNCDAAV